MQLQQHYNSEELLLITSVRPSLLSLPFATQLLLQLPSRLAVTPIDLRLVTSCIRSLRHNAVAYGSSRIIGDEPPGQRSGRQHHRSRKAVIFLNDLSNATDSSQTQPTQMPLHLTLQLPDSPVQPSPHLSTLRHGVPVRAIGPVPTRELEPSSVNSPFWRRSISPPGLGQSFHSVPECFGLTTISWQSERCVGQTGAIPRLGFRSLCLQDSPLGLRGSERRQPHRWSRESIC